MLDVKKIKEMPPDLKKHLKRMCQINLAQISFYHFCRVMFPRYYKPKRNYLNDLCVKLQLFYENKLISKETGLPYTIFLLNMPPRHYKSLTISLFECWMLGKDTSKQVITACYNNKLAVKFAKGVRDIIQQAKPRGSDEIVYYDIFPETQIKKGHASAQEWSLSSDDAHLTFLATSFESTLTGFGTNGLMVIDDQIKDASDALNQTVLDSDWDWFCNTMLSRVEAQGKIVVNMTRWNDDDICGRILADEDLASDAYNLIYEAMDTETGEMLCEEIFSVKMYNRQKKLMNTSLFFANYHQRPINNEARLFKTFKEYDLKDIETFISNPYADIRAVIDTTQGKGDYLCCMAYLVHDGKAYITNILHRKDITEDQPKRIAEWLISCGVKKCRVERNKEKQLFHDIRIKLDETFGVRDIELKDYYSTTNKSIKIQTAAWWIQNYIYYPKRWAIAYSSAYNQVFNYMINGKNKLGDDAPDVLAEIKLDVHNEGREKKETVIFSIQSKRQLSYEEEYFYGESYR